MSLNNTARPLKFQVQILYFFDLVLLFYRKNKPMIKIEPTQKYFIAFGKYQEDIRKLLLSNEKNDILPENMYLMIALDNGFASMDHIITAPSVDNCVKYHMHNFVVPKTLFCLLVGSCIPESLKKIHRHKEVCSILVTDVFKTDYGTSIIKKILGATPRGGAKGFI